MTVRKKSGRPAPGFPEYRCSLPGLAGLTGYPSRNDLAEREGFEPSVGCPTHDFQSCTFGLSVTSPRILRALGGEGGIRTLEGRESLTHFECVAFDHSATSPRGSP